VIKTEMHDMSKGGQSRRRPREKPCKQGIRMKGKRKITAPPVTEKSGMRSPWAAQGDPSLHGGGNRKKRQTEKSSIIWEKKIDVKSLRHGEGCGLAIQK